MPFPGDTAGAIPRGLGAPTGRPANLIANGSFETPADAGSPWLTFSGWRLDPFASGPITLQALDEPDSATDGEHGLLLAMQGHGATTGQVAYLVSAAAPAPAAGTVLRLRATRWWYTQTGSQSDVSARLLVQALNSDGTVNSTLATVDQAASEGRVAIIDTTCAAVPAGATGLRVALGFVVTAASTTFQGYCRWDNIYVDTLYDVTALRPRGGDASGYTYFLAEFTAAPAAATVVAANFALTWPGGSATPAVTLGLAGGVDENRVLLTLAPGSAPPAGAAVTLTVSGVTRAADGQALNVATASATAPGPTPAVVLAESFDTRPPGPLQVGGHITQVNLHSGTITVTTSPLVARGQALQVVAPTATAPSVQVQARGGPRGRRGLGVTLLAPANPALPDNTALLSCLSLLTSWQGLTFNLAANLAGHGSSYFARLFADDASTVDVFIANSVVADATTPRQWGGFVLTGDGFAVVEWTKDGTVVSRTTGARVGNAQRPLDYLQLTVGGTTQSVTVAFDNLILADRPLAAQTTQAGVPSLPAPPALLYWRDRFDALSATYTVWDAGGATLTTTAPHFGAHSLQIAPTLTTYPALGVGWPGAAPASLYTRVWFALDVAPVDRDAVVAAWPGLGRLAVTREGEVQFVDTTGTVLASGVTLAANGAWHALAVEVVPGAAGASQATLWVDGQAVTSRALTMANPDLRGGVILGAGEYGDWRGRYSDWWLASYRAGAGNLRADDFAGADLANWSLVSTVAPTLTSAATLVRNGPQALLLDSSGVAGGAAAVAVQGAFAAQAGAVSWRCWLRARTLGADGQFGGLRAGLGGTALAVVGWRHASATYTVLGAGLGGGAAVDTGVPCPADDQWHAVEIQTAPRADGTATLTLWVDGVQRWSQGTATPPGALPNIAQVGTLVATSLTVLAADLVVSSLGPVGPGPTVPPLAVAALTATTASVDWGQASTPAGWPGRQSYVLDVTTDPRGAVRWEVDGGLGATPPTDAGNGSLTGLPVALPASGAGAVQGRPLTGLAPHQPRYARLRVVDTAGQWTSGWVAFTPADSTPGAVPPPPRPRYEVRLLDPGLTVVGVLSAYDNLKYTRKINKPGAVEVHGGVFAGTPGLTGLTRLAWLQVWRNGVLDFMGQIRHRQYELAVEAARKSWTLDAIGQTYEAMLAKRIAAYGIALSGVATPPWGTFTAATDVRTGQADQVLAQYIDLNAGPSCPYAALRLPHLAVPVPPTDSQVPTITNEARFDDLLALSQKLAAFGFDFALAPDATGGSFTFTTYVPRLGVDRTPGNAAGNSPVIFAPETGTVTSFQFWETGLDITNHYLVGGPGDGTARLFLEASEPASVATWGEQYGFLDSGSSSSATQATQLAGMATAGQGALDEHAQPVVGTRYTILPLAGVRYKTDWDLGDFVLVQAADIGLTLVDQISEVEVTLTAGGSDNGAEEQVAVITGRPPRRLFNRLLYQSRAASAAGRR